MSIICRELPSLKRLHDQKESISSKPSHRKDLLRLEDVYDGKFQSKRHKKEPVSLILQITKPNKSSINIERIRSSFIESRYKGLAGRLVNSSSNIKRNMKLLNSLNSKIGAALSLKHAENAFCEIFKEGLEPDIYSFNSLIDSCTRRENTDDARAIFRFMRDYGFAPDRRTFGLLISAYVKKKNLAAAWAIFCQMPRCSVYPNDLIYGSLINGYAESGELNKARELYEQMAKNSEIVPQAIVLNAMLKAYTKAGHFSDALKFYKDKIRGSNIASLTMLMGLAMEYYWPEQCHYYKKHALELYEEAVKLDSLPKIIERPKVLDGRIPPATSLNLHRLPTGTAQAAVLYHLKQGVKLPFEIIVGLGHHSIDAPKLGRDIGKLLEALGCTFATTCNGGAYRVDKLPS